MSEQTIYNNLRNAGMSVAGACALMGNMKAESGMKSNIAQRGMTKLTDEQYTEKFDRQPESCYKDGVGYGLCQWTYWTRKQALRQCAASWGVSVGDEDMQVAFAVKELKTDNAGLWAYLCGNCDIYTATERICKEFERPAVNNTSIRYNFAVDFYNKFNVKGEAGESKGDPGIPTFPPDQSIMILQTVLCYNGYTVPITGYKDETFMDKLREFVTDIGG